MTGVAEVLALADRRFAWHASLFGNAGRCVIPDFRGVGLLATGNSIGIGHSGQAAKNLAQAQQGYVRRVGRWIADSF